jgi:hypothetical protein
MFASTAAGWFTTNKWLQRSTEPGAEVAGEEEEDEYPEEREYQDSPASTWAMSGMRKTGFKTV